MAPVVENIGYWGPPTSTLDWCESNYEVISMNDKYQHEYKLFFDILIATTCFLHIRCPTTWPNFGIP